jgi:ABC-type multidrug transport system ATPase subunit
MPAPLPHPPLIHVEAVSAGFDAGRPVHRGLTLRIDAPGLTLLQGSNGSGKSTLVEVLSGHLPQTAGTVTLAGVDARSPEASRVRRICRTEPALYPTMTARDHVVFASGWCGADPQEGLRRAERHGLGPWLDEAAEHLSTGNRRKLWTIVCTSGDFDVVVLDEPFNGLDGASTTVLCEELTEWAARRAVLVVSHRPPAQLAPDAVLTLPGGADPRAAQDEGIVTSPVR